MGFADLIIVIFVPMHQRFGSSNEDKGKGGVVVVVLIIYSYFVQTSDYILYVIFLMLGVHKCSKNTFLHFQLSGYSSSTVLICFGDECS